MTGWLWAAVAAGGVLACAVLGELVYRRRHPYVIGLRPFSPRRYARYVWGRVSRAPAETMRIATTNTEPYLPWLPLLLRRPRMARFFWRWDRLRRSGVALESEVPWLALEAIEWLDAYVEPEMRAFEWGSGGSTLYLARRVDALVTVEHDPGWYARVSGQLEAEGLANVRYLLREPAVETGERDASTVPGGYASSEAPFAGRSFRDYCAAIDELADGSFDIVVVDGRARPSCIWHARGKVRPGGALVVDNSERPHYAPGLALLEGWARRDFAGPVAFHRRFSTTSVFVRPS